MTMPRSSNVSPRRRGGKKNGGGNISYAESDDSDAGTPAFDGVCFYRRCTRKLRIFSSFFNQPFSSFVYIDIPAIFGGSNRTFDMMEIDKKNHIT